MDIIEFTETLVKSLCKQPELVKVEAFDSDEEALILEIIVHNSDMGSVIGRNGKIISAIRTLANAHSYLNDKKKIKINIDSF